MLPNLDDCRWADLVEQGRALIPVYGAEWTDHNIHDPGITLMELLAWVAEMDIYQLNQVPDRHKKKFLELIGVVPQPAIAARTVIGIALKNGGQPLALPAGLEFAGNDLSGSETRFRILAPITAVAGSVAALQSQDAAGFHDLTPAMRRGDSIQVFGPTPQPGAEFYIGLSAALPPNVPVRLFFNCADGRSGCAERKRLLEESRQQWEHCHHRPENPCAKGSASPAPAPPTAIPAHYGVRTAWEFFALGDQWVALDAGKNQVEDCTRAFTLDGSVVFTLPVAMAQKQIGAVPAAYFYLRCRFQAGAYDAPPQLGGITFNGVPAQQAVPVGSSFAISPTATIQYLPSGPPKAGDTTQLQLGFDAKGQVASLTFGADNPDDPQYFVQEYRAPSKTSVGKLGIEAVLLGSGSGTPEQQFVVPELLAQASSFDLFSHQAEKWQSWARVEDFDSSAWADFPYLLDSTAGLVSFSSREKTNVPRENSKIFVRYRATRADLGNVAAGIVNRLADSAHNRALLYDASASPDGWTAVNKQIETVRNTLPAQGGAAADTVARAAGRATALVENSGRAVTLADYERLALETPGTLIARVKALANLHPSFPCFEAPGMITVIVVPHLPQGRPSPSMGLQRAVLRYLRPRRVIGTRVEVVGPTYLEVAVHATVQAAAKVSKPALQQRIVDALNRFFDPLAGGPDGNGWPFGRDVYHAEIMQIIDRVAGVDHVVSLELVTDACRPQCGNVCLGPTWLVSPGEHQVQVV